MFNQPNFMFNQTKENTLSRFLFAGKVDSNGLSSQNSEPQMVRTNYLNRRNFLRNCLTIVAITTLLVFNATTNASAQGRYITGDFHQHTTYTDGSHSMSYMMEQNNKFGLD